MTAPILIVGAGIAGLTMALELARRAIPTRVVERAPILKDIGAGLQLPPNASRILDRHEGLAQALDTVAIRPEAIRFINGRSGGSLARMPLGERAMERWGAPYRLIHRADLQRVLLSAVHAAGIEVSPNSELVGAEEGEDGLVAHIARGEDVYALPAAALIGADGLRSRVRQLVDPGGRIRFTGHVAWRALMQTKALPGTPRIVETGLWLGPGAHLVYYPVSNGDSINIVAVTPGRETDTDPEAFKAAFAPWCSYAQALVHRSKDWKPWPLYERDASGPWGRGRITLIGDAAHAMLPHLAQGAAQAIEDAALLADKLAETPDNPSIALRYYELQRRTHVARIQRQARLNGQFYQMPRPLDLARNMVLRASGAERLMKRVDWLYADAPEA